MADLNITAASVTPGSDCQIINGIAGATIAAGETVYADSNDSKKFKLADANASVYTAVVKGMALNSCTAGQGIRVAGGKRVNVGSVLTAGKFYGQSATPGKIVLISEITTGWRGSLVGWAETASVLVINVVNTGVVNA